MGLLKKKSATSRDTYILAIPHLPRISARHSHSGQWLPHDTYTRSLHSSPGGACGTLHVGGGEGRPAADAINRTSCNGCAGEENFRRREISSARRRTSRAPAHFALRVLNNFAATRSEDEVLRMRDYGHDADLTFDSVMMTFGCDGVLAVCLREAGSLSIWELGCVFLVN